MAKCILLARFSPRPNADACESCDVQLDSMRRWCADKSHEVIDEFREDALSGDTAEERPTLTLALSACKRGSWLICRDFQRISRNARFLMYVAADLAARGVTLYSLTEGKYTHEDDELWLSFGVRALFGEYMRRKTKKRTKARMLEHQKNGRLMSKEPRYGSEIDPTSPLNAAGNPGRTQVNQDEQLMIGRIVVEANNGTGPRAIARKLNSENLLCRGRQWNHVTIAKILQRER